MSECKHDGGFYLVNTKEGESVGVVCYDCGKGLMIIISEQQKENEELRAQVAELKENSMLKVKCMADMAAYITVLRGALERIKEKHINPSVNHQHYPSTTSVCLSALHTTPAEAAEKVGKLVLALEQVQKAHVESRFDHEDGMSIEVFTRDIHIVVDEALAEWKGEKP